FQAEDGIRDKLVTGVQTCALPISHAEGLRVERDFTIGGQKTCDGCYGEVHYDDVRVPATSLLGERNGARAVAETLGDAGHLHYRSEERRVGKEGRAARC